MAARRKNPTVSALRKHPQAILVVTWQVDDTKRSALDLDFEPTAALTADYDSLVDWTVKDQAANKDAYVLLAEVTDTQSDPMKFGRWQVIGDDGQEALRHQGEIVGPAQFILPDPVRKPRAVKPKVKARVKSPAAAVLDKADDKTLEPPKPKRPQRKPNADAAALKKRLAEEAAGKGDDGKADDAKAALKSELVAMGASPVAADEAFVNALVHAPKYKGVRGKALDKRV